MSSYLAFDSEPSGPIPSDPETSHPETEASLTAVVTTPSGTLNLRMNPNAGSQILERIPRSTRLPVLEKGVDWSRVVYLGTAGYVMNSFLTFDQSDSNLEKEPEAEQPEETRPEEDKQENERQQTAYVNTQSGSLNLRRQPGLNSTVLAAIPRNASVNVTAYGSEWCAVQYGGYQGYVMTQYLRFDEAEISAPKTEETPVKETPSEIEQSEETKESYITIGGIVLDVTLEAPPSAMFAAANTNTALYTMCAENGEKMKDIPAGEEVEILLVGEMWCRVAYLNEQGYCPTGNLDVRESNE